MNFVDLVVLKNIFLTISANQSLISKLETEESGVSEEEAQDFSSGEATQREEELEEDEDSDDLVCIVVLCCSCII